MHYQVFRLLGYYLQTVFYVCHMQVLYYVDRILMKKLWFDIYPLSSNYHGIRLSGEYFNISSTMQVILRYMYHILLLSYSIYLHPLNAIRLLGY